MAITTRYAVNMAMQYNEVELDGFLINPSVGSRRFLTEAEQTRLLRATEVSALYFITDTSGQFYSARYRWYDSGGTMLNEYLLDLTSASVHNSIPVDWSSFFVPSGATRMTVAIIGAVNGFSNGSFTQGSGDLFTSWTLTQPSRTNYFLYSQQQANAVYGKLNITVNNNATTAPDGTNTASSVTFNNASNYILQAQVVQAGAPINSTIGFWVRSNSATSITIKNAVTGTDTETINVTTSWQFVNFTTLTRNIIGDSGLEIIGTNGTTIFLWQWQMEAGDYVTPSIVTLGTAVTTSLGEFLQDATGGPDGSRCLKMWASAGSTLLRQATNLFNGFNYTIRFRAKVDYADNGFLTIYTENIAVNSTDWAWYSVSFTSGVTGSTNIDFDYVNDSTFGFIYLDDVSISITSPSLLSEERTFILDDSCVAYEYQLNWLNKLGGRDTWVMTGFPIETVDVKRNNEIEYSARTNYASPNRIYGYRENKSRKSITLTHQCKTRATAEWLKSELIDSIDVMLLIDGVYYPCDVVPNSIVVSNTFSQDYSVRVTLRYAYDINVQTR